MRNVCVIGECPELVKGHGYCNTHYARWRSTGDPLGLRMARHGLSHHPLHGCWMGIRARCTNPTNTSYAYYGGRGIHVADVWADFLPFYEWSLASGWEPGLELDRENNNGPYSPDNCRWVTRTVNMRNTSRNHTLHAFGEARNLSAWADDPRCAVTYDTLKRRIYLGWESELALTRPIGGRRAAS